MTKINNFENVHDSIVTFLSDQNKRFKKLLRFDCNFL